MADFRFRSSKFIRLAVRQCHRKFIDNLIFMSIIHFFVIIINSIMMSIKVEGARPLLIADSFVTKVARINIRKEGS